MLDGKMHQTTIRLSPDLWETLELECSRLGVSAAQFLREAAIARLAYTSGRDGDPEYAAALVRAGVPEPNEEHHAKPGVEAKPSVDEAFADNRESFSALGAQSRLARNRSVELREHATALRARPHRV